MTTSLPVGGHATRARRASTPGAASNEAEAPEHHDLQYFEMFTLFDDGTAVGNGRVGVTEPMVFSGDETTDIGYESGTTATPDYTARDSRFVAKIHWVQIDLGDDDHDHFIDPDERLRIAMARQ